MSRSRHYRHSYKVICTRNTRNECVYSALARLGNDSQFRAQNSFLKLVGHIFEIVTLLLQIGHVSPTKMYSKFFLPNWTLFDHTLKCFNKNLLIPKFSSLVIFKPYDNVTKVM